MCQYIVFFIISFLSFGLDKRLLQDPAYLEERRNLGMFGHHQRPHYEDYFAGGHKSRRRSSRYQTPVGGDDIEVHKLSGHFPFDKKDGDNWESILQKSKQEADAMAAKAKAEDDAEMKKQNNEQNAEKKKEDDKEKAEDKEEENEKKKKEDKEKKKEEEKENKKNGGSGGNGSGSGPDDSEGKDSGSGGGSGAGSGSGAKQVPNPKYLVRPGGAPGGEGGALYMQGGNGSGLPPAQPLALPPAPGNPAPGKHDLTANYVPDQVPKKKACEFTPSNCFCGARPTQQMDLLCASKKREYCGWFCKHKMGGREGKPKTGSDQFAGKPKKLKPEKRAHPEGCPKPSLKSCEAIYSDPNSPDYVGDGYAPPGANCVCHIDQKTGHAVITDLPNTAALPGAGGAPAASGAPAGTGAPVAPAGTAAPTGEAANSNGAGPDSGNSGNPAADAINGAAAGAVNGIQNAQNTVNAAGTAAAQTVNAANQAAENLQEESKGMWHHAKGLAGSAAGHVGNAVNSVVSGVKNIGSAIFGDEAESEADVQSSGKDEELYFRGERHPTREEASVSNGLTEVFEDDEVALGSPDDFGVH